MKTGETAEKAAERGTEFMKILLINGSPKREQSDTMRLTRAFLDGMRDVLPVEVQTICPIDRVIEPCRGCFACMHDGSCVCQDDMKQILADILSSDLLLFSFPLYCYGMPAPLKGLIDRTLPLNSMNMQKNGDRYEHTAQTDYSRLRYAMICGCGFPNARHNFEALTMQFRLMFGADSLMLTIPEAPMFSAPEAVSVTKPFLETVRQAGRAYASDGIVDTETMAKLAVPMIPEDVYARICSGQSA